MKNAFSSNFKLFLKKMMKGIKEFQQLLKLCEMIISLIIFYATRKRITFP
jgi:hypothetical protein